MRIVTRGDFDGLASSVLLTEVENIREIRFVHPKDAQDGKIAADGEDIVVNLPFVPGCGLWFDHHISELEKSRQAPDFKGRFEMAPSCARVIFNHYAERRDRLARFNDLLEAVDCLDSAQLTLRDVTEPGGWILLGLTLDPRSGLGPEFQKYFRWLVEYIKEVPLAKVLEHPEVKKRTERVLTEQDQFNRLLRENCRLEGPVIVTDFRKLKEKPVGNRFLVYALYPQANVEVRLFPGLPGSTVVAVGHSIFNRTCRTNVGELLAEYGGGGHRAVGSTQLPSESAGPKIQEIINRLKNG